MLSPCSAPVPQQGAEYKIRTTLFEWYDSSRVKGVFMKSIICCVAILTAQFMPGQTAAADDDSVERSALAFQTSRFEAMIEADIERLDTYLADDLTYSHTTGWMETKSEFLATVESANINYMSVTPRDVDVRIYGDVAVMTGLSDMQGAVGDREVTFTIRFLDVSRRVGDSWQLVAWQSVRIPDDES
jgi:ketosteroid isomerase-like protein